MRVSADTKAATRQRILEQAQVLLAAKGYEQTTTRDLAEAAGIAVGTLFNYFPTKEAIMACLVSEAFATAQQEFASRSGGFASLEEELFGFMAATLRRLKPFRTNIPALLETTLSPVVDARHSQGADSLRVSLLEAAHHAVAKHGLAESFSAVALQLYWTLYSGVLVFWANDRSPKQEDTLALLDQSVGMFVGWLRSQKNDRPTERQEARCTKNAPTQ